mgnify:FL=1
MAQLVNREPVNDGTVGLKFTNNIDNNYKGSGEPMATAYNDTDPDPITE